MSFFNKVTDSLLFLIIFSNLSLGFLSKTQISLTCPQKTPKSLKSNGNATVALILARGGSKGIPLKNLAKINRISLLARTVQIIRNSKLFPEVWVSTDNWLIAREAEYHGAHVHFRSDYSARDEATSMEAVQEFLSHHPEFVNIALVQSTSVFLRERYLERAVELFRDDNCDCVFSVVRSWKLRWDNNGPGKSLTSLNFDIRSRPRRQDWHGELIETGMFYFARRLIIERDGVFQNERCGYIEIDPNDALEIDVSFHLTLANHLIKQLDA